MYFELKNIIDGCDDLVGIKKNSLQSGDQVIIITENSVYSIKVDENGHYFVSGGWFDKNNLSPMKIKINGCTWGNSVIKSDIIAAQGLFLEFSNRVITSKIMKYFVIPKNRQN